MTRALAQALRERGHAVDLDLGASGFRCDLAVRAPHAGGQPLAIPLDGDDFYASGTSNERFRLRPAMLAAFGWKVELVLEKDWFLSRRLCCAALRA